jgi:hypothetical protein
VPVAFESACAVTAFGGLSVGGLPVAGLFTGLALSAVPDDDDESECTVVWMHLLQWFWSSAEMTVTYHASRR